MSTIQYNPPDYFLLDDLLTDEYKIIRSSVRDWVNRSVKPIIEDYYEKALDSKGLKQTQKEDIYTKLQRLNTLSSHYATVKMESAYYLGAIFAKREDGEQARRYLLEVCQSAPFSLDPNSLWMKSKNLLLSLSDLDGEF